MEIRPSSLDPDQRSHQRVLLHEQPRTGRTPKTENAGTGIEGKVELTNAQFPIRGYFSPELGIEYWLRFLKPAVNFSCNQRCHLSEGGTCASTMLRTFFGPVHTPAIDCAGSSQSLSSGAARSAICRIVGTQQSQRICTRRPQIAQVADRTRARPGHREIL